jgi:hypothetical protein
VCNPPTAKPGTSQHEFGRAVDFGGDLTLAAQLAPRFNLEQTVPGEKWHYEEIGNRAALAPAGHLSASSGRSFNPLDAAGSIGDVFSKLTDGHLWLRVAMVVGGLTLALVGLIVLGVDVRHLSMGTAAGAAQIHEAAGAGKPVG